MRRNDHKRSPHYDAALRSMRSKRPDEYKALGLLRKAHRANDPRAAYALATWHLFAKGGLAKDLHQAVDLLRDAAESGLPEALFDLAVCYERGAGVSRNARKAAFLYVDAAIRGDKQAVFEVGRCYYAGIGLKKDRAMANVWFQRAEELGVYEASGTRSPRHSKERSTTKLRQ